MSTPPNPERAGVFQVSQPLLETALAVTANQGGEILGFIGNESGVKPAAEIELVCIALLGCYDRFLMLGHFLKDRKATQMGPLHCSFEVVVVSRKIWKFSVSKTPAVL